MIWRVCVALAIFSAPVFGARDFVRASSQWIQHGAAVVVAEPLSVSGWFKTDDLTVNQVICGVVESTGAGGRYLMVRGLTGGDPLSATAYDGTTSAQANSSGSVATGTWHHGAAVFAGLSSRAVYLDGTKTTNATTITSANAANRTNIGAFISGNSHFSGKLAELAIWNVALTDDEVASLAAGVSALRVRPSALVFYVPLWGPILEYTAGLSLTNSGGSSESGEHPRRFR